MALPKLSDASTATGASADPAGIVDEEPMWMQITVPVSSQAAMNGRQYPLWMLGSPRLRDLAEAHRAHPRPCCAAPRLPPVGVPERDEAQWD